jgi:transcriptional regulator GlxA family with amidase domain
MTIRTIAILVFPDFQMLDVIGPSDVFSEVNRIEPNRYRIRVVSLSGGGIRSNSGITLHSESTKLVSTASVHTLLIAGAEQDGLSVGIAEADTAKWVRRVAGVAPRYGSVCTGAFALAQWGLLNGKRVTTHWAAAQTLRRLFPDVSVDDDALFVNQGKVWTSGGVTAGIDMALEIVAQDCGRDIAAKVGKHLLLQGRRVGSQSQYSYLLTAQAGRYADLIAWMKTNLHRGIDVTQLSERANESVRTFHRHFLTETGHTPANFLKRLRLDHARTLLEAGLATKTVAKRCGLQSEAHLRSIFRSELGVLPSAYARAHSTS